MKKISSDVYWCVYCGRSDVPLIQLGKETRLNSLSYGEEESLKTISLEDSNTVEICEGCLRKALKLFNHE